MQKQESAYKKISLIVLCLFYIGAGINHFWHPEAYLDLIPPYFSHHALLNIVSGVAEIISGILMIIPTARKIAAYLFNSAERMCIKPFMRS